MSTTYVVRILPNAGSADHYYHFLLGFLFPLCLAVETLAPEPLSQLLVRSCGPLDPLLRELAIPQLVICPKRDFAEKKRLGAGLQVERIKLRGFDLCRDRPDYEYDRIRSAASLVATRLSRQTNLEASRLYDWDPPRILVIERGAPDPFYNSPEADRRGVGAGASRRIISNHAEMIAALRARFPGCINVKLENMPLARQIALFRAADVVLAQHGAALVNIVWMRPGTTVVEIGGSGAGFDHFGKLSAGLGVLHRRAPQASARGPVLVSDVVRRVENALVALPGPA